MSNYQTPLHQYEPAFYSGAKVRTSEVSAEYNAVSANTTLVMNTIGNTSTCHYLVEVTANSPTLTLPSATGTYGMSFIIKNTGSGTATLATTGGQTIDGASTKSLTQYVSLTVFSNGINWIIC